MAQAGRGNTRNPIEPTQKPGRLALDSKILQEFCRRNRIEKLSLFGSVLKGTSRADSDIDLLVEFEPGATPGLLALVGMEAELSNLLGGRQIDLRTAGDLSRHFRDEVIQTAEVQYARGG